MKSLLKKISKLHVLVIGDVMLDHYVWGDASRISPEAPVPVVDIDRDTYSAGGAANVALNLASLGAKATLTGFFGRDDAGKRLQGILETKKIATIPTPGSGSTIVKTRVLVRRQQLCRLDRESPQHDYAIDSGKIEATFEKAIRKCDAVILSDYAKGLLTDELVAKVSAIAREHGKLVAIDPKPRRKLRFHQPDLITPNRKEALQLAGIEPEPHQPFPAAEVCARIYEQYRPKHLVITLSEDGMLLSHNGKAGRVIPTAAREVFDVSGAGDTSIAALTLALAAGSVLEEAAQFANAAAGVVVGKLGTATVSPEEILEHVAEEK
ncbi:MAG TPA: D-glycero-beta-D-manno-heptose-7-phosphate kinase [Acidobacteriota bacterium]|nr:D-glycero-beta-D-manno-heptose-7-phosphate kinase [Acidobacteriota bacterium]